MVAFRQGLKELGFSSYDRYLKGEWWATLVARYKASSMPQTCRVCYSANVQLHHQTYERLGAEELGDVTPLCGKHHLEVHARLKSQRRFVSRTAEAIEESKKGACYAPKTTKKKKRNRKQRRADARKKKTGSFSKK